MTTAAIVMLIGSIIILIIAALGFVAANEENTNAKAALRAARKILAEADADYKAAQENLIRASQYLDKAMEVAKKYDQ